MSSACAGHTGCMDWWIREKSCCHSKLFYQPANIGKLLGLTWLRLDWLLLAHPPFKCTQTGISVANKEMYYFSEVGMDRLLGSSTGICLIRTAMWCLAAFFTIHLGQPVLLQLLVCDYFYQLPIFKQWLLCEMPLPASALPYCISGSDQAHTEELRTLEWSQNHSFCMLQSQRR